MPSYPAEAPGMPGTSAGESRQMPADATPGRCQLNHFHHVLITIWPRLKPTQTTRGLAPAHPGMNDPCGPVQQLDLLISLLHGNSAHPQPTPWNLWRGVCCVPCVAQSVQWPLWIMPLGMNKVTRLLEDGDCALCVQETPPPLHHHKHLCQDGDKACWLTSTTAVLTWTRPANR